MRFYELLLLGIIPPIYAIGTCLTPGPAFPPVNHVLSKRHYHDLAIRLDDLLTSILSSPKGWTTDKTSFAVQITSSEETLWSGFHTADILNDERKGGKEVTGHSRFRLA